jgi:hypothetical protein
VAALAALALLLASAGPAFAAAQFDYLVMRSVYRQDGTRGTVVAAELPASTPLPAEVRLNIPKDARISWVGEVLGGDPSQDPEVKYATVSGKDYDTLVMTLTKGRRAQAEFVAPGTETRTSALTTVRLNLVAPAAAKAAAVQIELPAGATVSGLSTGVAKEPDAGSGFEVYGQQYTGVRAGDKLSASVGYQPPPAGTQNGAPQTPPSPQPVAAPSAFPPLTALLFLVVLVSGTVFILKRMAARSGAAAEHDDAEDAKAGPARSSQAKTGRQSG